MKRRISLEKIHVSKFFYGYVYPVLAREFLFMDNYVQFTELVQLHFKLTPEQWEALLDLWELKESTILETE